MKRTFKRPDGTEEVVEGTAEELADYEKRLREGEKPRSKGKKPVLHGAELDGVPLTDAEVFALRLRRAGIVIQTMIPYTPVSPPYMECCKYCGAYGCMQTHIWCGTTTITSAGTSQLTNAVEAAGNRAFSILEVKSEQLS